MEEKINKTIGIALRQIRKEKLIKKSEIIELLNISSQQLNKYENGINKISAAKIGLILNKLEIDYNLFYNNDENNQRLRKLIINYNKIKDEEIKDSFVNLVALVSKSN